MVSDLHCILLKNIAQAGRSVAIIEEGSFKRCGLCQAAIKLGHWSDALRASDDALAIDDEAFL